MLRHKHTVRRIERIAKRTVRYVTIANFIIHLLTYAGVKPNAINHPSLNSSPPSLDKCYSTPIKRFEDLKPPKGKQDWTPTAEDRREGIVRSNLTKHFGFNSTTDLERAASFYNKEPDKYLEELSGWQCRPIIETGSSRTRFYPPSTHQKLP